MKLPWLKLTPWIVIAILLLILFFKGCGKEKESITVTFPEVKSEFPKQEPMYIPRPEISVIKLQGRDIPMQNPVNDSLLREFRKVIQERDSIKAILMYADLAQYRKFRNVFEDDHIKIVAEGEVLGYLGWLKPTYTIKERTIEQEIPKTSLRFLAGFELGANEAMDAFPLKLNLSMQNAKGNILSASFMRLNNENYYLGGYQFSILNLKN